ncbi:trypsin-like serine peptidase [Streptomyces sp. NPDC047928]|uniref:trypsin-like serine peptidase n=1 Tax=unclassified Streptomyces TaxID=2593676 RepID=UPI003720A0DE
MLGKLPLTRSSYAGASARTVALLVAALVLVGPSHAPGSVDAAAGAGADTDTYKDGRDEPGGGVPGERAEAEAPPVPQRTAVPARALPPVGVLLDGDEHWCTASVVDSPRGNVVATAAHCVHGDEGEVAEHVSFAPGFHGSGADRAPYGTWKVRSVQVDDAWRDDRDDAHDYAFLTLEPDARGRQVQRVVGGLPVDWASGPERRVTVVGYPNEDHNPGNRAVSCTTDTARDPDLEGSLLMECGGFWSGTSGSPWLAGHRDAQRPGRVIAVLSGGDTDRESTAVLFGADARALYERAVAAGS